MWSWAENHARTPAHNPRLPRTNAHGATAGQHCFMFNLAYITLSHIVRCHFLKVSQPIWSIKNLRLLKPCSLGVNYLSKNITYDPVQWWNSDWNTEHNLQISRLPIQSHWNLPLSLSSITSPSSGIPSLSTTNMDTTGALCFSLISLPISTWTSSSLLFSPSGMVR